MNKSPAAQGSGTRTRKKANQRTPRRAVDDDPGAPSDQLGDAGDDPGHSRNNVGAQSNNSMRARSHTVEGSISRPMQVPQWPLRDPIPSPVHYGLGPRYQPPPGRPPPRRPERPSDVPSILDGSRIQGPVPAFQYSQYSRRRDQHPLNRQSAAAQQGRTNYNAMPLNTREEFAYSDRWYEFSAPASSVSPVKASSIKSSSEHAAPDNSRDRGVIPMQTNIPASQMSSSNMSRSNSNMRLPSSSRRRATTLDSTLSLGSPIPEEAMTPSWLRDSYVSSVVIPENQSLGSASELFRSRILSLMNGISIAAVFAQPFDEKAEVDRVTSLEHDDGDDKEYENGEHAETIMSDHPQDPVRSASIGKWAKPALVMTKSSRSVKGKERQIPRSFQGIETTVGEYVAADINASPALPTIRTMTRGNIPRQQSEKATTNAMHSVHAAAGSIEPVPSRSPNALPNSQPAANIRPRSPSRPVVEPASRASITSLQDMIKRATKGVELIDKGNIHASQAEDTEWTSARISSADHVTTQQVPARRSRAFPNSPDSLEGGSEKEPHKGVRRICGLRRWIFILLLVLFLVGVIIAITISLLFVYHVLPHSSSVSNSAATPLSDCKARQSCSNGGTAVATAQGTCSCICVGGFTGPTCGIAAPSGCTTTDISSREGTVIHHVTLGDAIPGLISVASSQVSVPLSALLILAKFSTNNLSCVGQNLLVTFNGWATSGANSGNSKSGALANAALAMESVVTVLPGHNQVVTMVNFGPPNMYDGNVPCVTTIYAATRTVTATVTVSRPRSHATPIPSNGRFNPEHGTAVSTSVPAGATSHASPLAASPFIITDDVVDFARIAVLYILQQESLADATAAQSALQRFFIVAATASRLTLADAEAINIGGKSSVNLVGFTITIGRTGETVGLNESIMEAAVHDDNFPDWMPWFATTRTRGKRSQLADRQRAKQQRKLQG